MGFSFKRQIKYCNLLMQSELEKRKLNKIWVDKGRSTTDQWNCSYKTMILKFIKLIIKKSVIGETFIRNLKNKITNTWFQFQEMCILTN